MKKVSRGEETLELRPDTSDKTTAAFGNSNWADEFVGAGASGVQQSESTVDQDWTKEFTGESGVQADLADQWTQEFTSMSFLIDTSIKYPFKDFSRIRIWSSPHRCNHHILKLCEIGEARAEVFRSEAPSQDDFWSQLQRDWDKAAEENPSSMGWLKDSPLGPTGEVRKYILLFGLLT